MSSFVTLSHSGEKFEMCLQIFDLLPLILNNGTVSGEIRS